MQKEKSQNHQHIIEGGEQSWRTDTTLLQDLLSSFSNQDSVVLVKEQTNRSMEQNTEPPQIQPTDFSPRSKSNTVEQKQSFQPIVLEQLDIRMQRKRI